MCGICGYVGLGDLQILTRMRECMIHRGPDDQGVWVGEGLGLDHCRPSIIDLSPRGRQPMQDAVRDNWIVFNGEIYNFQEIRRELILLGQRFESNTDTEVILNAYGQWGMDFLPKLRGMFGMGIWDAKQEILLLARDRLGKKPIYYAQNQEVFVFASELKALLAHPSIKRKINARALSQYLRLQFIPSPLSIFEGVYKLPASHYLQLSHGQVQIKRYWQLLNEEEQHDEEEWLDILEAEILEATRLRLTADVPLGAFLSGGSDSTLVVNAMRRLIKDEIRTYSIGFEDTRFNELSFARRVSEVLHTRHEEAVLPPRLELSLFRKLIYQMDEPKSDGSFIPTYLVSHLARQSVTVALSGDGGDEAFGGYVSKYQGWQDWQDRWSWVHFSQGFSEFIHPILSKFPVGKRTALLMSLSPIQRYAELTYRYYSLATQDLLGQSMQKELGPETDDPWINLESCLSKPLSIPSLQTTDILTYLPEGILMKVDKMSMVNSLEVRSPLLDHRIYEIAFKIPFDLHWSSGEPKYLLKKLLIRWGMLGEMVFRPKIGFGPGLNYWFSEGWWEKAYNQLVKGFSVQNSLLSEKGIQNAFKKKDRITLWNLWIFDTWADQYLN
jgi:asparagine synthase (glutamine-hydrolysing)